MIDSDKIDTFKVLMGLADDPSLSHRLQFLCANMLICAMIYLTLRLTKLGDRAWYLTVYSSGVATSFGIYFMQQVYLNGVYNTMTTETEWSTYACIFFMAYCAMDLVIGSYEYDEAIDYKDGWYPPAISKPIFTHSCTSSPPGRPIGLNCTFLSTLRGCGGYDSVDRNWGYITSSSSRCSCGCWHQD
eukprot:1393194-Amorphochlora_amoeboformis.AAC.2